MRGFTLLELIVVVAIVGALAAIPIGFSQSDAVRLDAAVLAFVADLENARSTAVERATTCGVVLGRDGKSYAAYADPQRVQEGEPLWQRALFAGQWTALALREPSWIEFQPDGSLSAGGMVEIGLGNERRRVRLHEPSGTLWVTKP